MLEWPAVCRQVAAFPELRRSALQIVVLGLQLGRTQVGTPYPENLQAYQCTRSQCCFYGFKSFVKPQLASSAVSQHTCQGLPDIWRVTTFLRIGASCT